MHDMQYLLLALSMHFIVNGQPDLTLYPSIR